MLSVPTFEGSDFQEWSQEMTSYLKSQGLCKTLKKGCPKQEGTAADERIAKWEDVNAKALGSIMLHLHYAIAWRHRHAVSATTLLKDLRAEYVRVIMPWWVV